MKDRTGRQPLRMFAHVRITNPRHPHHRRTGTVIRIDLERRRVFVGLPGGDVAELSPLSVEVIAPRSSGVVK